MSNRRVVVPVIGLQEDRNVERAVRLMRTGVVDLLFPPVRQTRAKELSRYILTPTEKRLIADEIAAAGEHLPAQRPARGGRASVVGIPEDAGRPRAGRASCVGVTAAASGGSGGAGPRGKLTRSMTHTGSFNTGSGGGAAALPARWT